MSTFGKSSGGGRRGSARLKAPLPVILTTIGQSWCAALVDISETGARIREAHLPPLDQYLQVKVESIIAFASVKWVTDDTCGLEFDEPVARGKLARLRHSGTAAIGTNLTVDEGSR